MTLAPPVSYTAATGNFLTAALWNAQVRDATAYLSAPPSFRAHSEVTQALADNTWVTMNVETEEFDNYGGHSTSTNTSRYTVQVAGIYSVNAIASFAGNSTKNRAARILLNGAAYHGTFVKLLAADVSGSAAIATAGLIPCAVGDYIELQAYQNSGASLNTSSTSGDVAPSLSCLWVSN